MYKLVPLRRCEDIPTIYGYTVSYIALYLYGSNDVSTEVLIKPNLSSHYHRTQTIVHSARILNTISWKSIIRSMGHALSLSLIYIPSSFCSGYHGSKELVSNNARTGWSLWRENRASHMSHVVQLSPAAATYALSHTRHIQSKVNIFVSFYWVNMDSYMHCSEEDRNSLWTCGINWGWNHIWHIRPFGFKKKMIAGFLSLTKCHLYLCWC